MICKGRRLTAETGIPFHQRYALNSSPEKDVKHQKEKEKLKRSVRCICFFSPRPVFGNAIPNSGQEQKRKTAVDWTRQIRVDPCTGTAPAASLGTGCWHESKTKNN